MTDYTKLVKALRETSMDFGELDDVSVMLLDAAAAIEALEAANKELSEELLEAQAEKPHWVSVEDSMPDLLQFVLVCNDEGKCVVAQYVGYQTDSATPWRIAYSMYDTDAYLEADEGPVCYWMPLPEPPQEVQE